MLAVIQVPLVDGRRFQSGEETRLPRPVWSTPAATVPDFLRGMGGMSTRWRRGTDSWRNEDFYCGAHRWLRFDPTTPWQLNANGQVAGKATPIFRRWMSDGQMLFRLEVGARIWVAPLGKSLTAPAVGDSFASLLQHTVQTHGLGPAKSVKLSRLPAVAFEAYGRASSLRAKDQTAKPNWALRLGQAMVYAEFWAHEFAEFPLHATPVALAPELAHRCDAAILQTNVNGVPFRFVLIRRTQGGAGGTTDCRDVRLNLLRMHAELIGLEELHRWIQSLPDQMRQIDHSVLMPYLENALVMLRPDRGAKADREGFRIARGILEAFSPGRITLLLDEITAYVKNPSPKLLAQIQSLHGPSSPGRFQITMNSEKNEITLTPIRSPWASGSFYLFSFIAAVATVRVAFGQLNAFWIPCVALIGILVSVFAGVLQLRQDNRLSEAGLIKLIAMSFRELPLIRNFMPKKTTEEDTDSETGAGKKASGKAKKKKP